MIMQLCHKKRLPMSNQSSMCNTLSAQGKGNAPHSLCVGLLQILNSMHDTVTDRRCTRLHSNIPPVGKLALLTTLSKSLRCKSAAEHHTAEQYSKTSATKLWRYRYQASELQLWRQSEDSSQVILAWKVKIIVTISSGCFKTVSSNVNWGDWGWTMRDLDTIVIL